MTFSKWHSILTHFDKIMNSICRTNRASSDKEISLEFYYKWKKLFLFFSDKIRSLRFWRNFLEVMENIWVGRKPPTKSHVLLFISHVWISGLGQHMPLSSRFVFPIPTSCVQCLGASKASASGQPQLPAADGWPRHLFPLPHIWTLAQTKIIGCWDEQPQGKPSS